MRNADSKLAQYLEELNYDSISLVALTEPGNPGGPMSPFHPCNERHYR